MTETLDYGKALYYPYFGVRNENWLKSSLLYWDGIRRIGFATADPEFYEGVELIEAGLLVSTDPEPYLVNAEKRFEKYISPLLKHPSKLSALNILGINKEMAGHMDPFYRLDVRKMTDSLIGKLKDQGLAEVEGNSLITERWIAGVYMSCLAIEVSREIAAPPTTHIMALEALGEYLTFGQPLKDKKRKSKTTLIHLGIDFPSETDLANVPMKKIVKFHEKYGDERRHFRRAVNLVLQKANEIDNPVALEDYLSDQQREIAEAIDNHRRALNDLKIISLGGFLKISAPSAPIAVAGMVGALNPISTALLTSLGLIVNTTIWWAEQRSKEQKVKQLPYHYLWSLKKELGA